ncbi:MAG: hypothetical protein V1861_05715 [Candidatus Micrarchaeota archaeon]
MARNNTVFRLKIAVATITAGTSLGALFMKRCEPLEEERHVFPHRIEPDKENRTDCAPRKGDNRCEVQKGEADPLSITFDPESCGYCGDDIRQVNAKEGARPYTEQESGIQYQYVTERPSETAESCPVDFHCGNRRMELRQPYGAWIAAPSNSDGGAPNTYNIGIKLITENRQDCRRDYIPLNGSRDAGSEEDAGPEPAPPQTSSNWFCPSLMAPSQNSEMVNLHSASVWSVISRVNGAINEHVSSLRSALGLSDPRAKVDIRVTLRVAPSGLVYLNSMSATCESIPCGDQLTLINASQLTLDGLLIGSPGTDCFWVMNIRVPQA